MMLRILSDKFQTSRETMKHGLIADVADGLLGFKK